MLRRELSTPMKRTSLLSTLKAASALQRLFTSHADAFARRHLSMRRPSVAVRLALLLSVAGVASADNLAPLGNGIMGFTASVTDTNLGALLFHGGVAGNINDNDLNTSVDDFSGGTDGGRGVSFVGVLWPSLRTEQITNLTLYLATFFDGGWFGTNGTGPGASGALDATYLMEPEVQVSTNHGTTWSRVPHISDYLSALNGHVLPVAFGPPTLATANFQLTSAITNIDGIRIIGSNGGPADGNGFIGVFELVVDGVVTDSDGDGMPDAWETINGLLVGANDSAGDPDLDGLPNLQEFRNSTDPHNPDTDGDGYSDGDEVAAGTDPNNPGSVPANLALQGIAILGTEDALSGIDTAVANAGFTADINDDDLTSRVDTWNGASLDTLSYVGITWTSPPTNPMVRLQLNLAVFFDGGWFGVNNLGPGAGGLLTTNQDLIEPSVQASGDGGFTWTNVAFVSDYLTALEGHPLPAVAFGSPTLATAHFRLTPPLTDANGIRIIGTEGGTASGGFLGVFELGVFTGEARSVTLLNPRMVAGAFSFEFDSQAGIGHVVQFKNSLSDAVWQTLRIVAGDGTRKQVTDNSSGAQRLYRVLSQ